MNTTIDSAGRLVIPREIRREARLKGGDSLEIRCREGRIEIETVPLPVRLVRRGELLVAVPKAEMSKLSREIVEESRQTLRAERGVNTRP